MTDLTYAKSAPGYFHKEENYQAPYQGSQSNVVLPKEFCIKHVSHWCWVGNTKEDFLAFVDIMDPVINLMIRAKALDTTHKSGGGPK